LKPGESIKFNVVGKDNRQQIMNIEGLIWSASGGKINEDGTFIAGTKEGTFSVTVSCGDLSTTGKIEITKIKPPGKRTILTWRGEIQTQKWMNFYTKVLSRFATKKSLKITVDFTFVEESGVSEQLIDETKTSLREIGLNDEVTVTEKEDLEYI
jgi:hypothetical protein